MAAIRVEPTDRHELPPILVDDVTGSLLEEMAVAGNTAEAQQALGAEVQMPPQKKTHSPASDPEDILTPMGMKPSVEFIKEHDVRMRAALAGRDRAAFQLPAVALATATFLRQYGSQLAMDAAAMRLAVTNKLFEIANCGDLRAELKALEMCQGTREWVFEKARAFCSQKPSSRWVHDLLSLL